MTRKQAQILEHEGKPAFAVLPVEEYEAMCRQVEDLENLALLREAEQVDAGAWERRRCRRQG